VETFPEVSGKYFSKSSRYNFGKENRDSSAPQHLSGDPILYGNNQYLLVLVLKHFAKSRLLTIAKFSALRERYEAPLYY